MNNNETTQEQKRNGLTDILSVYWRAYGGFGELFRSVFFWLSLVLLLITSNFWLNDLWWDQVLSILPNLIGFTLGGFAIFLAFGDAKFISLISGNDPEHEDGHSPYMEVSSTFLHFVLIQIVALLGAILAKSTYFELPSSFATLSSILGSIRVLGNFLGYWLFLYGICSAAAAAIAIFRVAFWFDCYRSKVDE